MPKRRKRNKTEKQERGKDRENIGSSLGACFEERWKCSCQTTTRKRDRKIEKDLEKERTVRRSF